MKTTKNPWLEERGDRGRMQIGPAFKSVSYYEQLMLSIDYWMRYCDFDRNGLPVWNSSDHSGMDNQISRAGWTNSDTKGSIWPAIFTGSSGRWS